MPVRLMSLKGKVVEMLCSTETAFALGCVSADGQPSGDYLLVRTREGRVLVWAFHRRALER